MPRTRKRPCRICRRWFYPDPRAGDRQRACGNPDCQTARRQKTQANWRGKTQATPQPTESINATDPAQTRNHSASPRPCTNFPGTSRKTSSAAKALISLHLPAHYCEAPRKTSHPAIPLIPTGSQQQPRRATKDQSATRRILKPVAQHSSFINWTADWSTSGSATRRASGTSWLRWLRAGQQTPVIVIAEAAGRYLGHRRLSAHRRASTTGPRHRQRAGVGHMSEAEALVLARIRCASTASRKRRSNKAGCWPRWKKSTATRSKNWRGVSTAVATWIARRLALVDTLPEAVQQQVREGQIAPQIAMRYLAPVARVSTEQCLRMAQVFAQQHWTTRQAAAFYNAWRDARTAGARADSRAAGAVSEDATATTASQPAPTLESD